MGFRITNATDTDDGPGWLKHGASNVDADSKPGRPLIDLPTRGVIGIAHAGPTSLGSSTYQLGKVATTELDLDLFSFYEAEKNAEQIPCWVNIGYQRVKGEGDCLKHSEVAAQNNPLRPPLDPPEGHRIGISTIAISISAQRPD